MKLMGVRSMDFTFFFQSSIASFTGNPGTTAKCTQQLDKEEGENEQRTSLVFENRTCMHESSN
jgi:hypothetical protein